MIKCRNKGGFMSIISRFIINEDMQLLDEDFNDEEVAIKNNQIANDNLKVLYKKAELICDRNRSFKIYSEKLLVDSSKEQRILENFSKDLTFATNFALIQYYVKFFSEYYVAVVDKEDLIFRCGILDKLKFLHTYATCTTVRYLSRVEEKQSVYDTYQQKFEYCGELKNKEVVNFAENYLKGLKEIIHSIDMCDSSVSLKLDDFEMDAMVNQSMDIFEL